jgi:hypothetical protein
MEKSRRGDGGIRATLEIRLLTQYVVACYASGERANLLKHWQNQVYVPLGMGI